MLLQGKEIQVQVMSKGASVAVLGKAEVHNAEQVED